MISNTVHAIRPLLKMTFLLDHLLYGHHPAGYHLINILLHVGSGVLVYRILELLLHAANGRVIHRVGTGPPPLSFWTALLFLIHPLGTETVTYLSGRATGLMAFFYLAALAFFLRLDNTDRKDRKYFLLYSGALACFILALLSKETAVTLPPALLLLEVIIRRKEGRQLRTAFLKTHLPFWLTLILFFILAGSHPRYSFLFAYSLQVRPLAENLVTQLNVVTFSLSLFLFPWRLNIDHDLPVYGSLLQWPTPFSLAILAAMGLAGFLFLKRSAFLSLGIFWFFLHLLPTNSILPRLDLLSERNLYLPAIGIFLATVAALDRMHAKIRSLRGSPGPGGISGHRWEICLPVLSLGMILFLMFSTISRNGLYRNSVSLWADAVSKSPRKARPHNNLGYSYFLAGDPDRAIQEFRTALTINPNLAVAGQNLRGAWVLKKEKLDTHSE